MIKDLLLMFVAVVAALGVAFLILWGIWLLFVVFIAEPLLKLVYIFAGGAALS